MATVERNYQADILSAAAVLQVKSLSKRYRVTNSCAIDSYDSPDKNIHHVFRDVNIQINSGEFLTVVGPSGCGKSTLLNIIAGLDRPDEGNVSMNGQTISSVGPDRLVLFQEGALFPWLTVQQNVEFGLEMAKVSKDKRRGIANRYLEMVKLSEYGNSYIHQLSGGMKQRVAIARALALDPKILLMDEPFAALDVHTRENLYQELLQIQTETKKTILFVTHNIEEAVLLGDRVVVLSAVLAGVKREIKIPLPKPRDKMSSEFQDAKSLVVKELEEDFRFKEK